MIARDVAPGQSWAFREHATIAELDRRRAADDAAMREALAAHRLRCGVTAAPEDRR